MVQVTWIDAKAENHDLGGFDDTFKTFGGVVECQDIGYFVRADAKQVVLAQSRSIPDNDFRCSNAIPRSWIKQILILEAIPVEKAQEDPKTDP